MSDEQGNGKPGHIPEVNLAETGAPAENAQEGQNGAGEKDKQRAWRVPSNRDYAARGDSGQSHPATMLMHFRPGEGAAAFDALGQSNIDEDTLSAIVGVEIEDTAIDEGFTDYTHVIYMILSLRNSIKGENKLLFSRVLAGDQQAISQQLQKSGIGQIGQPQEQQEKK